MPGRNYNAPNAGNHRYGFNGKENDNDVKGEGNQQDYGMRIYDPRLVRFLSVDPITRDYPELTPYQYASNTPIQAIDLDGLEAHAVYDKATGVVNIIPDISKMTPGLNIKYVNAAVYKNLTADDRKKYNYGITIKNVFTGGHYDANTKSIVSNDPNEPKEKPISSGTYNILENKGNASVVRANEFFVLDPVDSHQYDKVDNRPGEVNSEGKQRTGYNFLPGTISHGCVTVCKSELQGDGATESGRAAEWTIVANAIKATNTESIPDRRSKWRSWVPFLSQIKYGTMQVYDSSTEAAPAPPTPPAAPGTSSGTPVTVGHEHGRIM